MECPICCDALASATTPTVSVPCGHLFHDPCLRPYIEQRVSEGSTPDCPLCREPIKLLGAHQRGRIPRELHEFCHPAVRRVYLAGRDAEARDGAAELDYLYARVADLQERGAQARQKELDAEGRVAAIMDLWKKEQVKVADMQRRLQQALLAQQNTQAVKQHQQQQQPEASPSYHHPPPAPAVPPPAPPPPSTPEHGAPWVQQPLSMQQTPIAHWGALPMAPPPMMPSPWPMQGHPVMAPMGSSTNAAPPPAVVTHAVHRYPSHGSPVGMTPRSMPLPPLSPLPPAPQNAAHHPPAFPGVGAAQPSVPVIAAPPPVNVNVPAAAYAPPMQQQQQQMQMPMQQMQAQQQQQPHASGSRPRHPSGAAREQALNNVSLAAHHRWAQQQQRAAAAYRQMQVARAYVQQQAPQPPSGGQPWAGPSS